MRAIALFIAGCLVACAPPMPVAPAMAQPVHNASDKLMDDTRILSADDMEGRMAGTPGGKKARDYILDRFVEIGLGSVLDNDWFAQPFLFSENGKVVHGDNLLARIKGTSGPGKAMVVMAHYDHVGVKGGQVYNGADDNASGVATLLLVAQSLKDHPPLHDVIFAVVDAEEEGEIGSRFLVKNIPALLPNIVMAVNFDMISRSDKNELYACGAHHFPLLRPRLEAVAAKAPVKLLLGHDDPKLGPDDDWTAQSDHIAFHEIHVPWVYLGVENHKDYHRPTDDFPAIPQDFFRRSAATAELAVRAFDADLDAIAKEAGR